MLSAASYPRVWLVGATLPPDVPPDVTDVFSSAAAVATSTAGSLRRCTFVGDHALGFGSAPTQVNTELRHFRELATVLEKRFNIGWWRFGVFDAAVSCGERCIIVPPSHHT